MTQIKEIDTKIISELLKNGRMSDRKLAKKLGVSQPIVTRKRVKFEKENKLSYRLIPELVNLGFEVVSFIFANWKRKEYPELRQEGDFMEKINVFVSKNPEIVFASSGEGLGMTRLAITVHKSYSDYVEFRRRLETEWGEFFANLESFTISLKSDSILQELTFENILRKVSDEPPLMLE